MTQSFKAGEYVWKWPVCEISRTCQKRLVIGVVQTRFSHLEFFAF